MSYSISDTSSALASVQRYIRHISCCGQCPNMYQSHFWQWPVSNDISDTSSALTTVRRYIRHISGSGQCPMMYQSHFRQWPVPNSIAPVVIKYLLHCKLPAAEVRWFGCFYAPTLTTALAKFHAVHLVVVDKVRRGTNSHVDVGI